MSVEKVTKAVSDFLSITDPSVLSIKGGWGVGKTYFWSSVINNAKPTDLIGVDRYAYVSLFGVTSLDELKFTIFEHLVDKSLIGKPVTIDNLNKNWDALGKKLGRKLVPYLKHLPWFSNAGSAIQSASFLSVNNALICFDDFERKGDQLATKDILGLVSLLKEQRNCKVVLIFNDEKMDEKSSKEYRQFREKVIDVEIKYSPIPIEAAKLVFKNNTDLDNRLIKLSTQLSIGNIRILSKIKKLVNLATPLLEDYEQEILSQVTHTITIAALCYYSHDKKIPSYEYLVNSGRSLFALDDDQEKPDSEKLWDDLLTTYEFKYIDEFDQLLFDVIESGYIDEDSFTEAASMQNEQVKANKSTNSFSAAWELYHNSFEDNEEELVNSLSEALKENGRHVTPLNMNGTIRLLKKLGKTEEATALLSTYIELNKDKPDLFDFGSMAFAEDIDDPEVISKFNESFNASKEIKTLDDVLEGMVGKNGWGSSDEEVLSSTTSEQFYEFFKKQNTKNLPKYVSLCLRFGRFQNASDEYIEIANNAEIALKRVGVETALNKIRIQRFGVKFDE